MSDKKIVPADDIKSIAATLKVGAAVDESGNISLSNSTFESTLPSDMTMDDFDKCQTHIEKTVAAQTLMTGEMGGEAMLKDPNLKVVSSEMKLGKHGVINVSYVRDQEGTKSPTDKTPVTRHGVATTRLTTVAGKSSRGNLKNVRNYLKATGEDLFG